MTESISSPGAVGAVKPWQSKTLWLSALVALAPLVPGVGPIIAANPELVSAALGVVFAGLRFVTSKPIKVK